MLTNGVVALFSFAVGLGAATAWVTTRPPPKVAWDQWFQRWFREMGGGEFLNGVAPTEDKLDVLFPGLSWEKLDERVASLPKRCFPKFLLVPGRTGLCLVDDLKHTLDGAWIPAVSTPLVPDLDEWTKAFLDGAGEFLPLEQDRACLVAEGDAVPMVLRALAKAPGLRDRIVAVFSLAGDIRGVPGQDGPLGTAAMEEFLSEKFRHDALDTDILRTTWYVHFVWSEATNPKGQQFPSLVDDSAVGILLEVVDGGIIGADHSFPRRAFTQAVTGLGASMFMRTNS